MKWSLLLVTLIAMLLAAGTALADRGEQRQGPPEDVPAGKPDGVGTPQGRTLGPGEGQAQGEARRRGRPAEQRSERARGRNGAPGTPRGRALGRGGNPGTVHGNDGRSPRAGGHSPADDRGDGRGSAHEKVTLCHATGSESNPYVLIEINDEGLHGHGGHERDIIPAPEGGCPGGSAPAGPGPTGSEGCPPANASANPIANAVATIVAAIQQIALPAGRDDRPAPRRRGARQDTPPCPNGGQQPAGGGGGGDGAAPPQTPQQQVAGATEERTDAVIGSGGGSQGGIEDAPTVLGATEEAPAGEVQGATASAADDGDDDEELPFTGLELAFVLLLALAALVLGLGARRLSRDS